MKNIFSIIILTTIIFGCNSSSEKKTNSDSTKTYNQVGVPNVNGNIPDTTNAINLTHKLDTISNHKDSAK
jgi:hypothetical protein